jgi:hypothetical protein
MKGFILIIFLSIYSTASFSKASDVSCRNEEDNTLISFKYEQGLEIAFKYNRFNLKSFESPLILKASITKATETYLHEDFKENESIVISHPNIEINLDKRDVYKYEMAVNISRDAKKVELIYHCEFYK